MSKEILKEKFNILATGNPTDIRDAKKEIQRLWKIDHKLFKKSEDIFLEIIENFDLVSNPVNKAAVISGMNLFFLCHADKNFSKLKDFTIKNLQHTDGRVREAMRKTGDWLYMSLSSRIDPFMWPEGKELSVEQVKDQKIAIQEYKTLIDELDSLILRYNEGESVEYIDEMKPSINKTLELFIYRFQDSPIYRKILESSRPIPTEVFFKRKELEAELDRLLKNCKSDYDVEDLKDIIYEEEGIDGMTDIIRIFDTGQGGVELQDILEIINDAWNYFPHRDLDGLCPVEMIKNYRSQ